MTKNFDTWNEQKKVIDKDGGPEFFHAREIWWCALGLNIGFEQDGSGDEYRRPVLILKGLSPKTCLVVPLTTSRQEHFLRPHIGQIDGKEAHAILSQLRVVDKKRLIRKVGYLDKVIFEQIRKAVKTMF